MFVGEVDDGHVKGLHNWIQTMVEESRGDLDYLGFVLPRRHNQYTAGEDDMDGPRRVVSIQLGWEVRLCRPCCFYGTDAAHLKHRASMQGVVCGPGGRYNTMPDERVDVADYLDAIRIYMLSIVDVCGGAS